MPDEHVKMAKVCSFANQMGGSVELLSGTLLGTEISLCVQAELEIELDIDIEDLNEHYPLSKTESKSRFESKGKSISTNSLDMLLNSLDNVYS